MLLGCDVDGDDAPGEVPVFHLAESGFAQQGGQPFLIGKGSDRGRQVFVDASPVARDLGADPGKQAKRIPIVEAAQPAVGRSGKFQADESTTRP